MKLIWQIRFWLANGRHRAWKQMELFSSTQKMKAVRDMHGSWKRFLNDKK